MLRKKIKHYVGPIRYKVFLERCIHICSCFIVAGLGAEFILVLVSRFIVIPYLRRWTFYLALSVFVLAMLWSLLRYPTLTQAVKLTDHLGLKERLMTALEFEEDDSYSMKIQREDTLQYMNILDNRPSYNIKVQWRPWIISGFLGICLIGLVMLQTDQTDQAKTIESLQEKISEETAWIEETIEKDQVGKLVKKMDDELSQKLTDEEKQALETKIEEHLEKLKDNIKKVKTEEEALKELAMTKNALKDVEEEMMEALDKLGLEEKEAMTGMEAMADMFADMESAINRSGKNLATKPSISQMAFSGEAGMGMEPGTGGEAMAGSGLQPGQGEEQGEGANAGGQSEDEGTGSSSSGSTNEEQETEEGGALQGGHHDGGDFKEGLYESLYPPQRLGGEAEPSFIQGDHQKEGERTYSEVQGVPTQAGEFVQYSQILSQYSNKATMRIDQAQVPPIMRDLVKEYFSSLNE